MSFGLLTTNWRRLLFGLNCSQRKNSQIIQVCSKLHNHCIHTNQHGDTTEIQVENATIFDPSNIGIAPLTNSANANGSSRFGYLHTWLLDDPVDVRELDPSHWKKIVADLLSRKIQHL